MTPDQEQQNRIEAYFQEEGLTDQLLKEDLLDHLACKIEEHMNSEEHTFNEAFETAKEECFPNGPKEFEKDLKLLTTQKPNIMMRKIAFIGGYAAALCLCIAMFFYLNSNQSEKKQFLESEKIISKWQYPNGELNRDFYNSSDFQLLQETKQSHAKNAFDSYLLFESFLTATFIIFVLTLLPFLFVSGYKKQNQEVIA